MTPPGPGDRVAIGRAKGRPMLSWVGKRPLREVRAFPSQLVDRFAPATPDGVTSDAVDWSDWPDRFDRGGLLFHGDNKEVLAYLLATGFRGKVDLVYVDPPLELAVEHLGIQRTRADTFFHGTLGKDLAYIVPFDHPTTQLDLQAVVDELERRSGEERDIVVVGLGRELSTVAWLDTYTQHRVVNRIRVIDLRTDERYGRFFEHIPASARVRFERSAGRLRVHIDDVISPSIMERLTSQEGILTVQVEDWRWVVDSVAIDSAYDGAVFDVDLIDVPGRRSDVVEGVYDLEVMDDARPAAVRITDMLGEEILVVEDRSLRPG